MDLVDFPLRTYLLEARLNFFGGSVSEFACREILRLQFVFGPSCHQIAPHFLSARAPFAWHARFQEVFLEIGMQPRKLQQNLGISESPTCTWSKSKIVWTSGRFWEEHFPDGNWWNTFFWLGMIWSHQIETSIIKWIVKFYTSFVELPTLWMGILFHLLAFVCAFTTPTPTPAKKHGVLGWASCVL